MSEREILELARVIGVIALVVTAGFLATPPNKVPLAMRGILRLLRKDEALPPQGGVSRVPIWKKVLSFTLVVLAFLLAKI